MIKTHWIFALLLGTCLCGDLSAQVAQPSKYRGWDTLSLSNGLLELQVAPAIGGRVIQVTLDGYEYLFVNDELAGCSPPPTGVGPNGEWLNYGGEKLWPAPQGHGIPGKWDGPPDPVLDGSPHAGTIVQAKGDSAAVRLVSRDDPRSGIRFSREIQLFADSTRVHVEATMTNVDTKPRRWGIWSVMQHNSANRLGPGYDRNMRVYCPLRKDSIYPNGFHISHGPADHSSFQLDDTGKLLVTHYERKMGKIRADSDAGWIATVHGSAGYVLAQRFQYHPEKEYPDEASVEIWLHGPYGPKAAQTDPKTFPYFLESELLSPFAQLAPGESYTFDCDWYAAAIGGDYPILACTEAGVECEPFTAVVEKDRLRLTGRFGVFCRGNARLAFHDAEGKTLGQATLKRVVSPLEPLILTDTVPFPPDETHIVALIVDDASGKNCGVLATTTVTNNPTGKKAGSRWSVERANQWYAKYPWICGCNYVPATAVNQLEMWQADTFDPKTIEQIKKLTGKKK